VMNDQWFVAMFARRSELEHDVRERYCFATSRANAACRNEPAAPAGASRSYGSTSSVRISA
jgi:hypothetical protein